MDNSLPYEQDKPLSVIKHLEELRNRILFSLLLIILFSSVAYFFIKQIMNFLIASIGTVYFMGPTEAFWVQLKLAMFCGLYFALPFIFYQFWKFVEIGLKQKEKKNILPLSISSFLLFSLGGVFCYFIVVPVAVKFLLSYGTLNLQPLISVSKYLSFVGCLVFAFGLTFQLPLVIMFLSRIGIVDCDSLVKFRRFAILGSFIIGAALTPTPDMVNQTLLALPMIVLYEISILLVKIFQKKKEVKSG